MQDEAEEALFGPAQGDPPPRNGKNGDEFSERILSKIDSAAQAVPVGIKGVRGIRSTQLLQLVREAVEPERQRHAQEEAAQRRRVEELEAEVARLARETRQLQEEREGLRVERERIREAQDETRHYELPRLAALVEAERARADDLAEEVAQLERRAQELEASLQQSEEARARQGAELDDALQRTAQAEDEERSQAEHLLLALDERIHQLETSHGVAVTGAARADEDEETLRLVLEHYARAEERAARIAALEEAVYALADGAPGSSAALVRRREALEQAREAERSSSRFMLELIKERLEKGGRDPRVEELVKTLHAAQEVLQEEAKRRTVLERTIRSLEVRLVALESSRLRRPRGDDPWGEDEKPTPEALTHAVEDLLAREDATQQRIQRLSLATRAALERMAQILDQALAAGSLVRDRVEEDELVELLESAQDPLTVASESYLAHQREEAVQSSRRGRRPPTEEELGVAARTAAQIVGPPTERRGPPELAGLPEDLYSELPDEEPGGDWLAELSEDEAQQVDRRRHEASAAPDPDDAGGPPFFEGDPRTGAVDGPAYQGDPRTAASSSGAYEPYDPIETAAEEWEPAAARPREHLPGPGQEIDPRTGAAWMSAAVEAGDDTQSWESFVGRPTRSEPQPDEDRPAERPRDLDTRRELALARDRLSELESRLQEQLDRVEELERTRGHPRGDADGDDWSIPEAE